MKLDIHITLVNYFNSIFLTLLAFYNLYLLTENIEPVKALYNIFLLTSFISLVIRIGSARKIKKLEYYMGIQSVFFLISFLFALYIISTQTNIRFNLLILIYVIFELLIFVIFLIMLCFVLIVNKVEENKNIFTYSKINNIFDSKECPICYEEFKPKQHILMLKCNHIFCKKCGTKWINNNENCPICRSSRIV